MDYQRRERQVTYHSPSCKMYLRHDFEHRCAYCGAVEEILSPVPSVRELLFEKDHFVPQDSGIPDVHKYPNLYYACKKCNGLKNNLQLPLDPCVDDIWFGDSPQLIIGDASKGFFVDPQTAAAERYVELLQLNSRYQLEIREELKNQVVRKKEREQILSQLDAYPELDSSLLLQIRKAMMPANPVNQIDALCGSSTWGKSVASAYNLLLAKGYSCEILLSDAPYDAFITIDDVKYHIQIRIDKEHKSCKIPCELLLAWQKNHPQMGILQYILQTQSMLFYPIDYAQIDWSKKNCLFTEYIIL